jgi:hypothetical protein
MSSPHLVRGTLLVLGFALFTVTLNDSLSAQPPANELAELRDLLEVGLKARRPEEFRFIARVVALVGNERLPRPVVTSTYHWARKKAGPRQYAYPYFERALRIRAARIGVRL